MKQTELSVYLEKMRVKEPDHYFDFFIHDTVMAKEEGLEIPLPPERKSKGQISLGCYLFVHEYDASFFKNFVIANHFSRTGHLIGEINNDSTIQYIPLYAGKAVRIKNRLRQHWRNPPGWLDKCFDQGLVDHNFIDVHVAVWMMESREEANAFEVRLIENFGPRYNIRKN